jgi:hypothetical protein
MHTFNGPSSVEIALLVLTSVSDMIVQWAAVFLFLNQKTVKAKKRGQAADNLPAKIFWSLVLPTAFQVVSIFVLVWENSKTTRALGSLLVACWQGLAILVVAEKVAAQSGITAAIVGILAVMLWRLARNQFFHQEPCVGFEFDFFFSRPEGDKPFFPLCLT